MSNGQKTVLLMGRAGCIVSQGCRVLASAGYTPVTCGNLVTGWRDAVKFDPFKSGDLLDRMHLDEVFAKWQPEPYWPVNVMGSLNLIEPPWRPGADPSCFPRPAPTIATMTGY